MNRLKLTLGVMRWSLYQCKASSGIACCVQATLAMKQLHSLQLQGCKSRDFSSPTTEELSPTTPSCTTLQSELPRQFLTSDGDAIVCVHPSLPVDICDTKPLHPYKPEMDLRRTKLNKEEVDMVQRLRSEDPSLWSVATLARLFNVKRLAISKVSPADEKRLEELEKEMRYVARMKPYKRKVYLLERQAKQQKRLKQAIAENNYKFPASNSIL